MNPTIDFDNYNNLFLSPRSNSSLNELEEISEFESLISKPHSTPTVIFRPWEQIPFTESPLSDDTTSVQLSGRIFRSLTSPSLDEPNIFSKDQLNWYNNRISKLLEENDFLEALSELEKMRDSGLCPAADLLNTILKHCLNQEYIEGALEVLDTIEELNDPSSDVEPYQLIITFCCRTQNLVQALQCFNRMKLRVAPNERICHLILELCLHHKEKNQAHEILNTMATLGFKPSLMDYSKLLYLHVNDKGDQAILELIERMRTDEIEMDLVCYNHLLSFYSNHNNSEEVENIFKKLKKLGIKPDYITHAIYIDFLVRINRVDSAAIYINKELPNLKELKTNEGGLLDVHSLSHGHAFILVRKFLSGPFSQSFEYPIKLVTGRGLHSKKKKLYAMSNYLRKKIKKHLPKYETRTDDKNRGILLIYPAPDTHSKARSQKKSAVRISVEADSVNFTENTFQQKLEENISPMEPSPVGRTTEPLAESLENDSIQSSLTTASDCAEINVKHEPAPPSKRSLAQSAPGNLIPFVSAQRKLRNSLEKTKNLNSKNLNRTIAVASTISLAIAAGMFVIFNKDINDFLNRFKPNFFPGF